MPPIPARCGEAMKPLRSPPSRPEGLPPQNALRSRLGEGFWGWWRLFNLMIEIIMPIVILIMMARKKGTGRKFRRYLRGAVDIKGSLTALATLDVVSFIQGDTLTEKAWLSSIVCSWSLDNLTPTGGVGPIVVGVAHSDYTDAEIEEWVENLGSWEEASMVQQEIGKRRIRQVGTFRMPSAATESAVLNDGRVFRTKCGWMLSTGMTLKVWAYNSGTATVDTTVPVLDVQGHANLWPA